MKVKQNKMNNEKQKKEKINSIQIKKKFEKNKKI